MMVPCTCNTHHATVAYSIGNYIAMLKARASYGIGTRCSSCLLQQTYLRLSVHELATCPLLQIVERGCVQSGRASPAEELPNGRGSGCLQLCAAVGD